MSGLYNATAWGQQTLAAQTLAAKASGRRGGMRSARKRRAKAKRAGSVPRKRRAKSRGKARLVKGSAAAKRYMASIRRRRKK
jgi:hypothetical protein